MNNEYGVLAYVPGTGNTPQEDEAHFDGWYADREEAEAVFRLFLTDYPKALVHLINRLHSDWRSYGAPSKHA